jgi:hypothetical protein
VAGQDALDALRAEIAALRAELRPEVPAQTGAARAVAGPADAPA